jgi:Zn finger protein HypA/HybF involved in hydrogenase expression
MRNAQNMRNTLRFSELRIVKTMRNKCEIHAEKVRGGRKCAKYVQKCETHAEHMRKLCGTCVNKMWKKCAGTGHAQNMLNICQKYAQNMPKTFEIQ